MSPSASFLSLLTRYRSTVLTLAAWELRSRYAGTLGGILWSLVSPAALILVYWLVFEVGFRAQGTHGLPFIVWFITGIVPWMTFSEIVNNSAHTITANTHLVKKTVFPVELLPLVNVTTVLGLHLVLLVILGGVLLYYRVPFTAATLQLPYFLFGLACLSLGLSWLVSAVTVFFRDFSQVIGVLLKIGRASCRERV
jgi:ABC-type polysaccharide/polyol phosphate export permease